ncbi:sulfatase-like hydrolase/transferase [Peribacillus muralis]|uniref:sulfatase-like hydrolase/transferase n=1 Tax=Peribacillus muralis TaxID=264697 RepID=UPI001F4DD15C|nr:sulfatase-like hydrolase/transferase [Peribacillus muralis]MCK1992149.1 sulfatase-like hydrolase/transferase [Peribacillus muralis]MCK2012705.1 sulfatase-like hydrolase/transferase [Peribacillus muralis]
MTSNETPNILLIMTDQQRFDTIAAGGNPHIHTPNLDRLCAEGVRFDYAYSEMPECVPARALMLTGLWGHETGVMDNSSTLSESTETFVDCLAENGYWTEAIGKMHFAPVRASHGFSHLQLSEEIPNSVEEDDFLQELHEAGFNHVHEPHGIRHEYYYMPQVSQLPDELHTTSWTGKRTVEFIKQNHQKPWFAFTSFIKPHPPFDPTIPYLTIYNPETLPLPIRQDEDLWPLARAQNYWKWRDQTDDNTARLIKAAYYASITQIDSQIGSILDTLEETGLRESTLIIFTSDHGEMLGDHDQWGKRSFTDSGSRIPFILSWPGRVPEGIVRKELIGLRDIAPTILHAAGLNQLSDHLPGMNLLSIIDDKKDGRDITFGEYGTGNKAHYMARKERWKYIYAPNGCLEALYDMEEDPEELCNLIEVESYSETANDLRNGLISFFREEGYLKGLSPDGQSLESMTLEPIDYGDRGRQYAQWTKVNTHEHT